jgi:NAD(P)-dependent dehydrogenase (short-subunit alcohol dehydrogenase family)
MLDRLRNKRCLIVGGTGGIGLAAARLFLAEGACLVLAGLDAHNPPAPFLAADATQPDQIETLFEQTVSLLGGLDVLYHVAGSSGRHQGDGPLHACTDAGWQATLDANLTSTFLTNRAAVRHFLAQRQAGVILNMASALVLAPAPGHFDTMAYTAAKGGVVALTRLAAARYAADGIRVNALAPGLIDTPMATRATTDPAILHFLRTKQPLVGGLGRPEDLAEAALFLCGDAARFVTGVVLPLDGGWCVSDGQYGSPAAERLQ